jgi:drug/metabolite transporter (DMT)-like permease
MHDFFPEWIARPAAVLSILAALAGALLIFWASVTGDYTWAIWGGVAMVGAGLLWHVGDYAATRPPPGIR